MGYTDTTRQTHIHLIRRTLQWPTQSRINTTSTTYTLIKGSVCATIESETGIPTTDSQCALAHCVSKDLITHCWIACDLNTRYGWRETMKLRKPQVGNACVLTGNSRYIYYVAANTNCYITPTTTKLRFSLISVRTHRHNHALTTLAIPKIACGLDQLTWTYTQHRILDIVDAHNITIMMCTHRYTTEMTLRSTIDMHITPTCSYTCTRTQCHICNTRTAPTSLCSNTCHIQHTRDDTHYYNIPYPNIITDHYQYTIDTDIDSTTTLDEHT